MKKNTIAKDQSVRISNVRGSQIVVHSKKVTQKLTAAGAPNEIVKGFEKLYAELSGLSKTNPDVARRIKSTADTLSEEVEAKPKIAEKEEPKGFWKSSIESLEGAAEAAKTIAPVVWQTAVDLANKLSDFFGVS